MYKLYRFTLLLLQDNVTTLTEDRANDGAASNSLVARTAIVAETETDASNDYVFVYGMFYEAVYQELRVPRFWVLLEQCIPGRFSSPRGPTPTRASPCGAAWIRGYYEPRAQSHFRCYGLGFIFGATCSAYQHSLCTHAKNLHVHVHVHVYMYMLAGF